MLETEREVLKTERRCKQCLGLRDGKEFNEACHSDKVRLHSYAANEMHRGKTKKGHQRMPSFCFLNQRCSDEKI